MTPGLTGGPPFPSKARQGSIVAIASIDSPSVPLVIGKCEIDVSSLQEVRGVKGHAVENIHWAGDELWSWSATGKPGTRPPGSIDGWLKSGENEDGLVAKTAALDVQEDTTEGGVPLSAGAEKATTRNGDRGTIEDAFEVVDDKPLSTQGKHHMPASNRSY